MIYIYIYVFVRNLYTKIDLSQSEKAMLDEKRHVFVRQNGQFSYTSLNLMKDPVKLRSSEKKRPGINRKEHLFPLII